MRRETLAVFFWSACFITTWTFGFSPCKTHVDLTYLQHFRFGWNVELFKGTSLYIWCTCRSLVHGTTCLDCRNGMRYFWMGFWKEFVYRMWLTKTSSDAIFLVIRLVWLLSKLLTTNPLQGVAYRDIKLENTLLDSSPRPLVKICDFGYSKHAKFQSAAGEINLQENSTKFQVRRETFGGSFSIGRYWCSPIMVSGIS